MTRPRHLGRPTALVLGIVCALLARHAGSGTDTPPLVLAATLIAVVTGALGFSSQALHPSTPATGAESRPSEDWRVPTATLRVAYVLIGGSVLAAFLWSMAPYSYGKHEFTTPMATVAAIIWASGICAGIALMVSQQFRAPVLARRPITQGYGKPPIVIAFLVVIVVAGAALRLWHLGTLPEGVWSDEVDSGLDASRLLNLPFQAFAPGNSGHNPSLYFYVMAALFKVAGHSLTMVRLTSAIFGVLAIVATYILGRACNGRATGVVAAVFIAFAPWAITFSRVGMPDIPVLAITGAGYACLVIALGTASSGAFLASGLLLGLSFLTYPGAYVPSLVALALLVVRVKEDQAFRAATWPARWLLPLGMLVAATPSLVVLLRDTDYALARVRFLSLLSEYHDPHQRLIAVLSNTREYLLMFTVAGDHNGRHNLSGAPMLDAVTGACLLLGVGMCLRNWRSSYHRILLAALGANLVSGIFSVDYETPHAARTIGALAPVVVIAALPLLELGRLVRAYLIRTLGSSAPEGRLTASDDGGVPTKHAWRRAQRTATLVARLTVALPLCVACALGSHRYFDEQANSQTSWLAMNGVQTLMARAIPSLTRQGYTVSIPAGLSESWIIPILAPGWEPRTFDPRAPIPAPLPKGRIALIVPAGQLGLVGSLPSADQVLPRLALAPSYDPTHPVAYVLRIRAPRG